MFPRPFFLFIDRESLIGDSEGTGAISLTIPPLKFDDETSTQVFTRNSFSNIQCFRNHTTKIPSSIRHVAHTDSFEITIMDVVLDGRVHCRGIETPEYEILAQYWDIFSETWIGWGILCHVMLFSRGEDVATNTLRIAVTPFSERNSVHAVISTHSCDTEARSSFFMKRAPIVIRKDDRMYLFSNETNYYFDKHFQEDVSCAFYVPVSEKLSSYLGENNSTTMSLNPLELLDSASHGNSDLIQNDSGIEYQGDKYFEQNLRIAEMGGALIRIPATIIHDDEIQAVQIFRDDEIDLGAGARFSCINMYTKFRSSVNLGRLVQSRFEVFHPSLFLRKYSVSFDSLTCQRRLSLFKFKPIISVQSVAVQSNIRVSATLQGTAYIDIRENDVILFMGAGMPEETLSVTVTSISIGGNLIYSSAYSVDPAYDGVGSSFRITFHFPINAVEASLEIALIFIMPVAVILPTSNLWGIVSLHTQGDLNFSYRVPFENVIADYIPLLTLSGNLYSMSSTPLSSSNRLHFASILTEPIVLDEGYNPHATCRVVNVSPEKDISHRIIIQCFNLKDSWRAMRRFYAEEDTRSSKLFDLVLDEDDVVTKLSQGAVQKNLIDRAYFNSLAVKNGASISKPLSSTARVVQFNIESMDMGGYGARIELNVNAAHSSCFEMNRFGEYYNCALAHCLSMVGCDWGMPCTENHQCVSNNCSRRGNASSGVCKEHGESAPSQFSWYVIVVSAIVVGTLAIVGYILAGGYIRRKRKRESSTRLLAGGMDMNLNEGGVGSRGMTGVSGMMGGFGGSGSLGNTNGRTSMFNTPRPHPFHASLYGKSTENVF